STQRLTGDAADLGRLQLAEDFLLGVAVVEDGALQSNADFLSLVADLDVRRSGDELLGPAAAEVDGRQGELVGIGVANDVDDLADDNLVTVPDRTSVLALDAQALRRR